MVEIIAQILGFTAVLFSLLSFQFQKGKTFFLFQFLLMLFFSVQFLLLGSYSGFALNIIGVFNSLIYYFKSENKRFAQGPMWLVIFSVAYLGAGLVVSLTTGKWLEFLPSVAMVFNLFTRYSGNLKAIRLAQLLVSSPFWFAYDFVAGSYGGCLNEVLAVSSAAIALIRYDLPHKSIKVSSLAKINLVLSVCGKRENGYHDISSVMQSITLCDKMTVKKSKEIFVRSNVAPENNENICYKAAKMFKDFGGADIYIEKNIPMAAGLGGGSSNAAATLLALNRLYGEPFTAEELSSMALSLGADVPFFLTGGTAVADGVGEELTRVAPFECSLVIVKHGDKLSTGDMYKKLDDTGLCDQKERVHTFAERLSTASAEEVARELFNDFERVNSCEEIKNDLLSHGALGAALSGSGPSVFGIFENTAAAKQCAEELKLKYENVFFCNTSDNAIIFE